jgi:membrane protein involved in colicin uptake
MLASGTPATTMSPMPSRRRPKSSPTPQAGTQSSGTQLSDAQRFAQSLRESEEADRRAKKAAADAKAEADRAKAAAEEDALRLQRAREAHQRAVEMVKEAKRTGKGRAEADAAWRDAKADLLELETGKRPAWAAPDVQPADAIVDVDEGEEQAADVD